MLTLVIVVLVMIAVSIPVALLVKSAPTKIEQDDPRKAAAEHLEGPPKHVGWTEDGSEITNRGLVTPRMCRRCVGIGSITIYPRMVDCPKCGGSGRKAK